MTAGYRHEAHADVLAGCMPDSDEAEWYAEQAAHRRLDRTRQTITSGGLRAAAIRLPVTPLQAAILAYKETP